MEKLAYELFMMWTSRTLHAYENQMKLLTVKHMESENETSFLINPIKIMMNHCLLES